MEQRELTEDEIFEELGREEIREFVRRGVMFEKGKASDLAYRHAMNKREARLWMRAGSRSGCSSPPWGYVPREWRRCARSGAGGLSDGVPDMWRHEGDARLW